MQPTFWDVFIGAIGVTLMFVTMLLGVYAFVANIQLELTNPLDQLWGYIGPPVLVIVMAGLLHHLFTRGDD